MDRIDSLLEYVKITNPKMTRERLIEELSKCHYSSAGLIIAFENYRTEKSG